ncbi:Mediator of RNA polymerase II transcription subunit 6 [Glugoides intestinalis]
MEDESKCFYDQAFLAQCNLTIENVMVYFALSPFYDKSSLNEILKMQSQFANIDISHKLTQLPGFYYTVDYSAHDLFIIVRKENRNNKTTITRVYYCMCGHIYCAPTIKAISDSRTIDILQYLNKSLDKYEEMKTFNWIQGFQFKKDDENVKANAEDIKFVFEALHDFEAITQRKGL